MISGEPVPDLNGVLIDEGPNEEGLLREYLGAIRARGLNGFLWLTSAVLPRLAPLAHELGLTHADATPLMRFETTDIPPPTDRYRVEVVKDQPGVDTMTDLMAPAFGLPLDTLRRIITVASLADTRVTHLVAWLGNVPVSAGTAIVTGSSVGIWNMATAEEHRRKGAGRAVLTELLNRHMLLGRRVFYLIATEAGKPLYGQVGFRTVDEAALWLIEA